MNIGKKNKQPAGGKKEGAKGGLGFMETKRMQEWSVVEVQLWLDSIGLGQYRDVFFFNEVDGDMLADIDEDDLIVIPIEKLGHRKKILKKVQTTLGAAGDKVGSSSSDVDHESESGASVSSKSTSGGGALRVKCVFHDEIRTITLKPDDINIDSFNNKIAKEFGAGYACKFRDEDGDMVTIRHTEEVQAVYEASRKGRVKLTVFSTKKRSKGKKKSSKKQKGSAATDGEDFGVLENFVDSVIVADRKGTIQFFNGAAEDLFGYEREDVLGENVRILMNDDDAKQHNRYLRRYRREGNSRIIGKGRKVVAKNKDGKLFDVWLSLSETDVSFTAIVQEIQGGERKMEKQDSTPVGDFSAAFGAFDRYPEPVVALNYDGFIQYANSATYDIFHHDKGSLAGASAAVLCPALTSASGDDLISDYEQTLTGKRGNFLNQNKRDVICYTKKGSIIAKVAEFSHKEVDGTRYYVVKLISQERGQAGTVMQTQREVISTLVIPAIIIDENAIVQEMNAAARDIFGYTIAHTLGHNVRMLMPPGTDLYENHTSYVTQFAKTGVGRGEGGTSSVVGKGREVVGIDANGNKLNLMLSVTMAQEKTGEKIFTGILQLLSKKDRDVFDSVALKQQIDVIEQLIVPACVITQDSIVRAFNKAAQELFGFSSKELVGRDVNELIPLGEVHNIHGSLVKNYADGKKNPKESVVIGKGRVVTGRHKNGHNVNVVLSVTERKDGHLTIFTGTFVAQ